MQIVAAVIALLFIKKDGGSEKRSIDAADNFGVRFALKSAPETYFRAWPIVLKNDFEGCSRDVSGNWIPEARQESNLIPPLPSLPTCDSIRSHLNDGSSDG